MLLRTFLGIPQSRFLCQSSRASERMLDKLVSSAARGCVGSEILVTICKRVIIKGALDAISLK
jgi:hypothetical protein